MKFHAWQLLDECIEHRPFCHRESICIIDQSIAIHIEFQLGRLHDNFVHDCGGIVVQCEARRLRRPDFVQIDRLYLAVAFALIHLWDVDGGKARLVALSLYAQQILAHLFDFCFDISVKFVVVFVAFHMSGIDETAVCGPKKRCFQAVDAFVGQMVGNGGIDL